MEFETHYALKLFFPNPAFTQIYFEAVANAIDARADDIHIQIRSDGEVSSPNVEITIRDNGIGFTDERYERFKQVKEPQDAYHKGMGRLVFLKYFSEVAVTSTYQKSKRTFSFVHNFDGKSVVADSKRTDTKGGVIPA